MDPTSLEFHVMIENDNSVKQTHDRSMKQGGFLHLVVLLLFLGVFVAGCQPFSGSEQEIPGTSSSDEGIQGAGEPERPLPTPFATRPSYAPGELVDYVAQVGDTLPALAVHFNTTVEEIMEANPFIPRDATTLPPGMPMAIPIYYLPFWGSPFQIIPDSLFVNGPSQVGFDAQAFVEAHPGWLASYYQYVGGRNRTGGEIVDYVAQNFSVSPQLLLAILEYQTSALSQKTLPATVDEDYILGYEDQFHKGMYLQLVWAANMLNNGYYSWRTGQLETIYLSDGTIENIDPWQNAATASIQYYFSYILPKVEYLYAIGEDGLARSFVALFGDPWADVQPHIPGSLQQPEMKLPFERGKTWAYTGGPHTGWGTGEPRAAVDFAPPSTITGCSPSNEWSTAVADGVVARTDEGVLELDLDGDGDPRTGWVVFYLHIAAQDRASVATVLKAGEPVGHPSCEGGTSTGTHIHIARKYNGEWIPADGTLPFNLEGWIAHNGEEEYSGTLTRFSETVVANTNAVQSSFITAEDPKTH
jgi:LysM repeat protein